MDKITLKKIITDFQKYANNLMNTGFDDCNANFLRLKKYIDENELIRELIQKKIRLSSANYEEYFLKQNSGFNYNSRARR